MSMAAARLLLAVFSEGTGREDLFHSVVISPDITDKDQMADCHLWGQFPSSSVLSVVYPQFSASHWSLPCFPYTFWFCFCLIVILTKTSFHPAFSSTPQFHFSSSHLSQVEEKHQCDTVKLNLLSFPSKGQAAQGKAAHTGHTRENYLGSSPCSELAQPVLEEHEIALPNLSLCWAMGSTSVPTCGGSTWSNLFPWDVGYFQSNASPWSLSFCTSKGFLAGCQHRPPANLSVIPPPQQFQTLFSSGFLIHGPFQGSPHIYCIFVLSYQPQLMMLSNSALDQGKVMILL